MVFLSITVKQDLQEEHLWLAGWQFSFWYWNWGVPVKKKTTLYINDGEGKSYLLTLGNRLIKVGVKLGQTFPAGLYTGLDCFLLRCNVSSVPIYKKNLSKSSTQLTFHGMPKFQNSGQFRSFGWYFNLVITSANISDMGYILLGGK